MTWVRMSSGMLELISNQEHGKQGGIGLLAGVQASRKVAIGHIRHSGPGTRLGTSIARSCDLACAWFITKLQYDN